MGRYTNLPTLNVPYLRPARMSVNTPGSAQEGARNGDGDSISIDLSGGPRITCGYDFDISEAEQHEYGNMIAARMNGSIRLMNVPILNEFMGIGSTISGITHSDGSLFSDGSGYSQASCFGAFAEAAAQNAGQVVVNIFGAARHLRHSDWLSVYHPDIGDVAGKGWRAFRYWEVSDPVAVTQTVEGVVCDGFQYELAISPPLRQAVVAAQRIELVEPKFVAKFAAGFNLSWDVEPPFRWKPAMQFVEAEVR